MRVVPVVIGILALTFAGAVQAAPPAYWVAEFEVLDAAKLKEFGVASNKVVEQFGGKFLSRRNKAEPGFGSTAPGGTTIIEFASLDKVRQYANSPELKALEPLRNQAGKFRAYYVVGGDNIQ